MKILLVEDNIVNQKVTTQFLTKWGLTVTIANHGREAVELVKTKNFNLVLMDLQMPEMDGCEATRYIRSMSDPYFKTLPIIAFTASSLADSKEKAEQLGMTDYLTKPLNPQEMKSKIIHYTSTTTCDQDFRPLRIKFEAYVRGGQEFKLSLINLMTINIRELQQAVHRAVSAKDIKGFKYASHKVKSTLVLLNDCEFSQIIENLLYTFTHDDSADHYLQQVNKFNDLSNSILKSLSRETQQLEALNLS